MSNPAKHDGAWPASHECYKCGYKALNDEVEPVRVDRELLWACVGKCNRELLSREEVDLTEKGDDIEPLVCSVCGRDDAGAGELDAGAGELDAGVFTCLECMKKRDANPTPRKLNLGFLGFACDNYLEGMMAMQADFNKKVGHVPHEGTSWKPNVKWLQKWLTCISQEVAECRDWVAWKHWSKRSGNKLVAQEDLYKPEHMKEIKTELIDIQHFLLSAFLELRMDADEVYALYCEKMIMNHDRQEGDY